MTFPNNSLPQVPALLPRRLYQGDEEHVPPLTEEELREFLENTDDLQDTIDLWNRVSGVPGVLDTGEPIEIRQQARKLAEIFFDEEAGVWKYVVAGRRVPESRMRLGVLRMSKSLQTDMRALTADLVSGTISRQQWYTTMREAMKNEYRAAYLAAIGGTKNYTRSEISKFGWRMRPHYRWLNNFLDQLESGKQALNGFAVMRAGMYARAANAIYQNERMRVAQENGFRQAHRVLGPNENHCEDSASRPGCIELADLGWIPIGEMPEIGEASCLSHCLCELEFRK